jgi:excisionase family DNA binding protein
MERRHPDDDGSGKRLCDVAQVASMLEVTESFVRRLVARQRIPFFKIGKFIRFDPDEVWTWVEENRSGVLP